MQANDREVIRWALLSSATYFIIQIIGKTLSYYFVSEIILPVLVKNCSRDESSIRKSVDGDVHESSILGYLNML